MFTAVARALILVRIAIGLLLEDAQLWNAPVARRSGRCAGEACGDLFEDIYCDVSFFRASRMMILIIDGAWDWSCGAMIQKLSEQKCCTEYDSAFKIA